MTVTAISYLPAIFSFAILTPALFEVCNNLTLPIGIWLHGIIYEKCDGRLYVVFWIIAVLTMLGAARGKKVYLKLQESS